MPDIIAKTTYDTNIRARHFHAELTGFLTGAHASAMPTGSTVFKTHESFGGGGQFATNYELLPNRLVLLANVFWSDGGAHYLVGTGPELVVRPDAAGISLRAAVCIEGEKAESRVTRPARSDADRRPRAEAPRPWTP